MQATELRDRFLVSLYLWASSRDLSDTYDAKEVAENSNLSWRSGHLKLIADQLDRDGYAELEQSLLGNGPDEYIDIRITALGIEEAERLLLESPRLSEALPASDRYVALSDNQKSGYSEELEELREAVRGSNKEDEEERLAALAEIAIFEATIIQQRVPTDLIQRFVDSILTGIMKAFSAAAVKEVAQRLIHALLKLLASA